MEPFEYRISQALRQKEEELLLERQVDSNETTLERKLRLNASRTDQSASTLLREPKAESATVALSRTDTGSEDSVRKQAIHFLAAKQRPIEAQQRDDGQPPVSPSALFPPEKGSDASVPSFDGVEVSTKPTVRSELEASARPAVRFELDASAKPAVRSELEHNLSIPSRSTSAAAITPTTTERTVNTTPSRNTTAERIVNTIPSRSTSSDRTNPKVVRFFKENAPTQPVKNAPAPVSPLKIVSSSGGAESTESTPSAPSSKGKVTPIRPPKALPPIPAVESGESQRRPVAPPIQSVAPPIQFPKRSTSIKYSPAGTFIGDGTKGRKETTLPRVRERKNHPVDTATLSPRSRGKSRERQYQAGAIMETVEEKPSAGKKPKKKLPFESKFEEWMAKGEKMMTSNSAKAHSNTTSPTVSGKIKYSNSGASEYRVEGEAEEKKPMESSFFDSFSHLIPTHPPAETEDQRNDPGFRPLVLQDVSHDMKLPDLYGGGYLAQSTPSPPPRHDAPSPTAEQVSSPVQAAPPVAPKRRVRPMSTRTRARKAAEAAAASNQRRAVVWSGPVSIIKDGQPGDPGQGIDGGESTTVLFLFTDLLLETSRARDTGMYTITTLVPLSKCDVGLIDGDAESGLIECITWGLLPEQGDEFSRCVYSFSNDSVARDVYNFLVLLKQVDQSADASTASSGMGDAAQADLAEDCAEVAELVAGEVFERLELESWCCDL